MKIFKNYPIILVLLFFSLSCSNDDASSINTNSNTTTDDTNKLDPNVEYVGEDIPYGDHPKQKINIYLPPNRDENTKVILLVHGGSWSAGKKEDMNGFYFLIKNQLKNLAIVNIGYRLASPETPAYPIQINDISSVIKLLKEKKEFYTISENYGFAGVSAGAHLSMLWAYAFDKDKNIEMVSNIVGPTNFTDPVYLESDNPQLLEVLKNLYGEGEISLPFLKEISPYHQLKASAPPTLMLYGAKDTIVPVSQPKFLKNRLDSLNIVNEYTLYPDQGHGWTDFETLTDTWTKMKGFIKTHMDQ